MSFGEVIILGLVQGLTEFLPVSSSGHLVVARLLFGVSDAGGSVLDAFLHLGTLLAVVVYFWRVWWGMVCSFGKTDEENLDKQKLAGKLVLATVPAAIAGYFWQDYVASALRSSTSVAIGLIITAVTLLLVDLSAKRAVKIERVGFLDAFIIGVAQVLALVPGVSRSGTTIAAGCVRGLSKKKAITFSFLLSAPIIAGAGLVSLGSLVVVGGAFGLDQLAIGFLVSFAGGLLAIHLFLRVVEKVSFLPFVFYLVGLATVLVLFG